MRPAARLLLVACALSLSLSLVLVPASGHAAADGAPGADAPPVEVIASGDPLTNLATATGAVGGAGGPGANATTDGEAGGGGGAGGRGGDATAVAEGVQATPGEILARAIARAGVGGAGGAAGAGMGGGLDGVGGPGGVGGDAEAHAVASDDAAQPGETGARVRLEARAEGGGGGAATGIGTRAGDGGQAAATAHSTTTGSDWAFSGVVIAGGDGGEGFAGADGGRGADASASNAVTAEGASIELEQIVAGGAGGHSADGGDAGDGGSASNRFVLVDPGRLGNVLVDATTFGGAAGASAALDPILGRGADADGGDAETILSVEVAGRVGLNASSSGGRGGGAAHVDVTASGGGGVTGSPIFWDVVARGTATGGDGADSRPDGSAARAGGAASGRVRVEAYGTASALGQLAVQGGAGGLGYLGGDAGAAADVALDNAVTGYAESGRLRLVQQAEGGSGGFVRAPTGNSTAGGDAISTLSHSHDGLGELFLISVARGGDYGTSTERAGDAIAVADAMGRGAARSDAEAVGGDGYFEGARSGFADATARATSETGNARSEARAVNAPDAEARAFAQSRSLADGGFARALSLTAGIAGESGATAEGTGGLFSLVRATSSAPFLYATGDWEPPRFWTAASAEARVGPTAPTGLLGAGDQSAFSWVSTVGEAPNGVGSAGFGLRRNALPAQLVGEEDLPALESVFELAVGSATADLRIDFEADSLTGAFGVLQISVIGDGMTMLDRQLADPTSIEAFFDEPMLIGELMAMAGLETVDLLTLKFGWWTDAAGGSVGATLRMTLVPEPGTVLLLGFGLALLGRCCRVRR